MVYFLALTGVWGSSIYLAFWVNHLCGRVKRLEEKFK